MPPNATHVGLNRQNKSYCTEHCEKSRRKKSNEVTSNGVNDLNRERIAHEVK